MWIEMLLVMFVEHQSTTTYESINKTKDEVKKIVATWTCLLGMRQKRKTRD
jgi:hypothetical protein